MFDYKKYYKFSLDKFIEDMVKIGKSDEDIKSCYELWADEIDGSIVRYVNEKEGSQFISVEQLTKLLNENI